MRDNPPTMKFTVGLWAFLIAGVAVVIVAALLMAPRPVPMTTEGVPVQSAPVIAQSQPGQEQAYPGRNNPGPTEVRSLDKINAAALAVGCEPIRVGEPASRLIEVAECLGAKAMAVAPGQK